MAKKDEKVRGGSSTREKAAPPAPPPARNGLRAAPRLDLLDEEHDGAEHRQFPRARMAVPFDVWIGEGEERRFSARLQSGNVSVSGAFLASTFFLPLNTELRVRFALEPGAAPVEARAEIVREERPDPRSGDGRSGFGIRFVEFFGQTEVTLAKLFLGEQLRSFAEGYMSSKRARSLPTELDRVVDALAAWELLKVTTPGDPWRPKEG